MTWRARGINPTHFIIHFIFIPYGLMASQQASDLAVNAAKGFSHGTAVRSAKYPYVDPGIVGTSITAHIRWG
ncbi:hypothetical protein FOMG_18442 [Fusarium oxysporum f. sp. melonis 26406]|uniref:Uncharacterized protein n=1 Tax=Fusarium oxysporum f. sp. melonis 26406 TaxID=1089452 RepID=W9ZUS6_FUSOX|nr:hypothetical protein FOMG_18442 [Fusarium oxysporum f. sp. melonis 26406]